MPEPRKYPTYDQIKQELMAAGQMPAPIPAPSPTPTPDTRYPFDPLLVAEQVDKAHSPYKVLGKFANPQDVMPGAEPSFLDKLIAMIVRHEPKK